MVRILPFLAAMILGGMLLACAAYPSEDPFGGNPRFRALIHSFSCSDQAAPFVNHAKKYVSLGYESYVALVETDCRGMPHEEHLIVSRTYRRNDQKELRVEDVLPNFRVSSALAEARALAKKRDDECPEFENYDGMNFFVKEDGAVVVIFEAPFPYMACSIEYDVLSPDKSLFPYF